MEIIKDSRIISSKELINRPHSVLIDFNEALEYFASPDTGKPLCLSSDRAILSDGFNDYDVRDNLPILIPYKLKPFFSNSLQVPLEHYHDSFLQYFLLATIKQSGEINSSPIEEAAQKHFFRMSQFLSDSKGLTLDVGCDDPNLGKSLFPKEVKYIGLDPFCNRLNPFRVIGVGEYLPFADNVFDNVVFNTSLDHIFDWRRGLSEAFRVLKEKGTLYISTYIWVDKADLISDIVHFHHFRDYEILGALNNSNATVLDSKIYESPKHDLHRFGLYIKAQKN